MAPEADSVVRVCSKSEVTPGSVKAFAVGDKTLAVYNTDGTFYVTDDECTHAAASLADGMIEGDVIEVLHAHGLVPYPDRQGDAAALRGSAAHLSGRDASQRQSRSDPGHRLRRLWRRLSRCWCYSEARK